MHLKQHTQELTVNIDTFLSPIEKKLYLQFFQCRQSKEGCIFQFLNLIIV